MKLIFIHWLYWWTFINNDLLYRTTFSPAEIVRIIMLFVRFFVYFELLPQDNSPSRSQDTLFYGNKTLGDFRHTACVRTHMEVYGNFYGLARKAHRKLRIMHMCSSVHVAYARKSTERRVIRLYIEHARNNTKNMWKTSFIIFCTEHTRTSTKYTREQSE